MSDNVDTSPGLTNLIAADEVVDATLGTVKVQYVKLMDGTLDGTTKSTISSNGLKVDGSAVTQPISGSVSVSNLPATQPVSGTVTATGPLTDTQLRASAVPVSGTFFPATQPVSAVSLPLPSGASTEATLALIKAKTDNLDVLLSTRTKPADTQTISGTVGISGTVPVSGTFFQVTQPVSGTVTATGPLTDTQLRASAVPVSGTFFQSTQPVSATSLPLPTGASTETTIAACKTDLDKLTFTSTRLLIDGSGVTQPVSGTLAATQSGTWTVQPGNTANTTPWLVGMAAANLIISTTAATGVGVTATLPAVASQFHYIGLISITKIFTAANAASATPLVVTSTNLPGSYALSFGQPLGTIGTAEERIYPFENPIKSSVLNTATTIVCPATTGIIWRVNVHYYAAI